MGEDDFAQDAEGELDLLMASIALDATGLVMIGVNYRDSSYTPHAEAAEIILEDEADHDVFAAEQLGRAVARFGPERVYAALREWLPRAVNFFGPPGSGFTYDCLRYGLKSRDNQELADLFLAMIEKRCPSVAAVMSEDSVSPTTGTSISSLMPCKPGSPNAASCSRCSAPRRPASTTGT